MERISIVFVSILFLLGAAAALSAAMVTRQLNSGVYIMYNVTGINGEGSRIQSSNQQE